MASHYQAHGGPGPSSYYMQPQSSTPPQSYVYNPNNPGPGPGPSAGPNGYPYQYGGPPVQMGGSHHPGMPPQGQGSSPRMNGPGGRGNGGGAGYINPQSSSRGGHGHASYAHAHANYRPYAHPGPYQHPHPHPHPAQMPPPKYPQAPTYQHHGPPPYGVYAAPPPASVWGQQPQHQQHQQQQQLSPLPKDILPLASPQDVVTPTTPPSSYYPPPPSEQNQNQNQMQPQHQPTPTDIEIPLPEAGSDAPPPPPPLHEVDSDSTPPPSSSYGQIGSISASASASSPIAPSSPTLPPGTEPMSPTLTSAPMSPTLAEASPTGAGGWAIWSRRPRDPARAPGVIISPHARPPPDVLANASGGPTPPASPPPPPAIELPSTAEAESALDIGSREAGAGESTATEEIPIAVEAPEAEAELEATEDLAEAPSSGASTADTTADTHTPDTRTPTTAATTMPSSPVSSATSLSSSATPVKAAPSVAAAALTDDSSVASAPAAQQAQDVDTTTTTSADAAPSPSVPAPAPAPVPPVIKSWASLLRPPPASAATASSSSAASAAGGAGAPRTKWALPTSSVVGFSVPAAGSASASDAKVSSVNRAAVLALLTSPSPSASTSVPSSASASAPSFAAAASTPATSTTGDANANAKVGGEGKLTPRGLVNTGNMCFANAVLQVLVYCAPFAGLFARLHALLGPDAFLPSSESAHPSAYPHLGGGGENANANASGNAGNNKEGENKGVLAPAPLVRATGAFLREFLVSPKAGGKKPAGSGNGAGSGSGAGKGKGKASPAEEEEEEAEAFIPTGVYDVLKGKKRFDHMRGGHQEDAEEFLGFFLDTLEEELLAVVATLSPAPPPHAGKTGAGAGGKATPNAVVTEEREEEAPPENEDGWLEVGRKNRTVVTRTIKSAESPITRIFGGKFRSTLRAPGQKDSVIVEDWRSLRLDIQRDGIHTIQDALALISHPQTVQMTHPSRGAVDASQQVLIEALPPVLVLHVKRFYYDTAVGGVVKVGKPIKFGAELDVGTDVIVPTARKQSPVRYKLFGAIYHHGVSASGGHYTLDVLHPTRFPTATGAQEGWVRIDDELVSDVRPADVFGATERDDARCAYLLFYRRIR